MKNLTITITDEEGKVTFEKTTVELAKEIGCSLVALHAEDVADELKDELEGTFYL